jgi:hypothetical protein
MNNFASRTSWARTCASVILAALAMRISGWFAPFPAQASLGQPAQSVETDSARMAGQLREVPAPGRNFTIKEIAAPAGLSVREYVSPAGLVFAVSWRGATPPDLRTLLGSYFSDYKSAAAKNRLRPGARYSALRTDSGLVVQTGGHMRALWGRAFVPTLFPSGVTEDDIQ